MEKKNNTSNVLIVSGCADPSYRIPTANNAAD